ncbi:MAG: hypothetical protein ABIO79_16935 [Ferruginibacter sp.]
MSQAFVKEEDEQWLHDIQPTVNALVVYLTRQNNGVSVYEKSSGNSDKHGQTVYEMSNGLSYMHNEEGKWMMIL